MKKENTTWFKYPAMVLLLFVVTFSGCEKDNDPDAPDLPPLATFVMDFSDFVDLKSAGSVVVNNWGYAASQVLTWNVVLTVNLIVPVASFYEAFNHKGIYEGNNEWIWSYNFMANGVSHKAELHGILSETQVTWEMYISKENVFSDFLWYSGTHNILRTEGQWILNGSPDVPTQYLQIDWTRGENDNSANVKYTNIIAGDDYYDSYIYYARTDDVDFDRYYHVYNAFNQNLVEIEWNVTSKAGRVKDAVYFEDALWHCWDNMLQNTDCN